VAVDAQRTRFPPLVVEIERRSEPTCGFRQGERGYRVEGCTTAAAPPCEHCPPPADADGVDADSLHREDGIERALSRPVLSAPGHRVEFDTPETAPNSAGP